MAARTSASLAAWRRQALRRLAASRQATLAQVARLPARELLRPRTQDRWSVKDVLAHLLACDEETLRRFRLIAAGRADRIHWFESMADADRFNARSVARRRRLGLATVRRRLAAVRAELIAVFARLPGQALQDPAHAYPVVQWLPAPGWSHERDHAREIADWWRSRRPDRGRAPASRARSRSAPAVTARAAPRPGARPRPSRGASPR